ncbi:MAG: TonB family protein [Planctomycetia bacterium]|nr:TonB family protein [Planctomycetia bacterium]
MYSRIFIIIILTVLTSCVPPGLESDDTKEVSSKTDLPVVISCKTLLNIAAEHYAQNNWDEVVRAYENVIQNGCPGDDTTLISLPQIYLYWAIAYENQLSYDSAAVILESGLKIVPNNIEMQKHLAFIYRKQRNNKELIRLFEDVCKLRPDNEETLINLAVLYKELFIYEKQIAVLKKIIELNPDNREALGDLIESYQNTGQNIEDLLELGIDLPEEKIFESLYFSRDMILGPPRPPPPIIHTTKTRVKFVPYDDPPRPLLPIRPKYPEIAREGGIEGTVIVQVFIDKYGNVTKAVILKGIPGTGLDEAAIDALRKTRFRSAKQRGKSVGVWISIPVNFKLK